MDGKPTNELSDFFSRGLFIGFECRDSLGPPCTSPIGSSDLGPPPRSKEEADDHCATPESPGEDIVQRHRGIESYRGQQ